MDTDTRVIAGPANGAVKSAARALDLLGAQNVDLRGLTVDLGSVDTADSVTVKARSRSEFSCLGRTADAAIAAAAPHTPVAQPVSRPLARIRGTAFLVMLIVIALL